MHHDQAGLVVYRTSLYTMMKLLSALTNTGPTESLNSSLETGKISGSQQHSASAAPTYEHMHRMPNWGGSTTPSIPSSHKLMWSQVTDWSIQHHSPRELRLKVFGWLMMASQRCCRGCRVDRSGRGWPKKVWFRGLSSALCLVSLTF